MTDTAINMRQIFAGYLSRPKTLIVLKVSYYNALTGKWINKTAIEFTSLTAARKSIRTGLKFYNVYNVINTQQENITTITAAFNVQGNNLEYKIKYELQIL